MNGVVTNCGSLVLPVLLDLLVWPCYHLSTKALIYRVFLEKVLDKRKEKMKMISRKMEIWVEYNNNAVFIFA